jgi:hypothetical protein
MEDPASLLQKRQQYPLLGSHRGKVDVLCMMCWTPFSYTAFGLGLQLKQAALWS